MKKVLALVVAAAMGLSSVAFAADTTAAPAPAAAPAATTGCSSGCCSSCKSTN
ncbi:acid resistance repetitive basic protein Asr [Ewingella americana]